MGNPADIERAKQGKEVWNAWAKDNPGAEVNFSGETLELDFRGFVFPGATDFSKAKFTGVA